MRPFAEVFFAQPEQGRPIELGIAAHVVVGVGVKGRTVAVPPRFFRVVACLDVDCVRVPVRVLPRHVVTTLENQDLEPRAGESVGERATAGTAADDDYVVVLHDGSLSAGYR